MPELGNRTILVITASDSHGALLTLVPVDPATGCAYKNSVATILGIYNPSQDQSLSVTAWVVGKINGDLTSVNRVYQIPFGATCVIGPLPPPLYNQPDGNVYLDFTGAAMVGAVALG